MCHTRWMTHTTHTTQTQHTHTTHIYDRWSIHNSHYNLSVTLCVFGCMCECIRDYLCLLQSIRCSSLSLFLSPSLLIGLLLYPSPLIGRSQKHDDLNKKAFVVGAHGRVRVDIEEVGNALQNKTSPTSRVFVCIIIELFF